MSSIIYRFAKADTKKKEVLTFYKFEQTVDKDIKTFTVVCTNSDCNGKYSKRGYRQPKWYKHIENYCCSKCHSKLKRI